jgi:processive 1,2-diacylglycerol beta-glucosyltransferase
MKKVYIFYTSIGTGHFSAAKAVQSALIELQRDIRVELYDSLPEIFYKTRLSKTLMAISQIVFPGVYNWTWQTGSFQWLFQFFCQLPKLKNRMLQICNEGQPDAILCTHALPCAIAAQASFPLQNRPLIGVATDFQIHPYWPVKGVDAYAVSSQAAKKRLLERGYPLEQIYLTGIPIHPSKSKAAPARVGSDGNPRVLVMAGGGKQANYIQIYPVVKELIQRLASQPMGSIQWRFIFGHSQFLEKQAERFGPERIDVERYGFVDNIPKHMAWADIILTKAGGMTLAEAFALGKPVGILSKGAGQEAANVDVVLSSGAGVLLCKVEDIFYFLREFQGAPGVRENLSRQAAALGSPDAACQVANLVERFVDAGVALSK